MKHFIKRYLLPLLGIAGLQNFYALLHRVSLVGMNIGPVGEIETSGESRLIRKLLLKAPIDSVIIDVGANFGEFSLLCAEYIKPPARIYAFEPVSSTYATLAANIRSAGLDGAIISVPEGLSDSARSAQIAVTQGMEGNASVYSRHQSHLTKFAASESIILTTLDAFCSKHALTKIFFLKIDIEGEELACLKGGNKIIEAGSIDYIQFEFGGCNIQSRVFFKDFWDLLSPKYRLFRILQHSVYPIPSYHELFEIFTTTNFLAVREGKLIP